MTSNDTSARWTNVVAASAFGGLATVVALRRWLVPPQQDESTRGVGEPLACFGPGGPYHRCIYLDWNATSPIFPEVTAAMEPFTSAHWGNPSSSHVFAATCRKALARARSNVAEMLGPGTSAEEVLFCSCGSEADNHAIRAAIAFGAAYLGKDVKPHIITSVIEHPAILQYLRALHAEGRIEEPSLLPVDGFGFVDPQKVRDALRENTVLVTIMHSNNEIGTIQPIQHIVHTVKAYNETRPSGHRVLVHTDAAQSCGKVGCDSFMPRKNSFVLLTCAYAYDLQVQVHVNDLGVDFATVVGHKFGAPKGCAALYVRSSNFRPDDGVDNDLPEFPSLIYGGGQVRPHCPRSALDNDTRVLINIRMFSGIGSTCWNRKRPSRRRSRCGCSTCC